MRRRLFVVALCALLLGIVCAYVVWPRQGVQGRATTVFVSGVAMPRPDPSDMRGQGVPVNPPPAQKTPFGGTLYVFKGHILISYPLSKDTNPGFVKTVTANSDGSFKIGLDPGEYTIALDVGCGTGSAHTMVAPGQWTQLDIDGAIYGM